MKKSTKGLGIFIGIVAIIAFIAYQQSHSQSEFTTLPQGEPPSHGTAQDLQKAPQWQLRDAYGKSFTSAQYHGKVIVLSFWTTWCAACKNELKTLNEIQKTFQNQNLQLIGIALDQDQNDNVIAFTKALNIRYPVLIGSTKIVKSFGNFNIIPATFIIDKEGNVVQYFHGTHSKQRFIEILKPLLGSPLKK